MSITNFASTPYASSISGYVITVMLGCVVALLGWIARQMVDVKYGYRDMRRVIRKILKKLDMDDDWDGEE